MAQVKFRLAKASKLSILFIASLLLDSAIKHFSFGIFAKRQKKFTFQSLLVHFKEVPNDQKEKLRDAKALVILQFNPGPFPPKTIQKDK